MEQQEGTGPTRAAREAMGSYPALVPSPSGTANSFLKGRIYPCGGAEQKGGRAELWHSMDCQGES